MTIRAGVVALGQALPGWSAPQPGNQHLWVKEQGFRVHVAKLNRLQISFKEDVWVARPAE